MRSSFICGVTLYYNTLTSILVKNYLLKKLLIMMNEIVYKYKLVLGNSLLMPQIKDKYGININYVFRIIGITMIILVAIMGYLIYSAYPIKPILYTIGCLLLLLLLTYLTTKLYKKQIQIVLERNGYKGDTFESGIKKFNKSKLKDIIEQKGIKTTESINILKTQIDKAKSDADKKLKIVPFSTVITVGIGVIGLLVKDMKLTNNDIHLIGFMLIALTVIYIVLFYLITDMHNSVIRARYYLLKEISELLGDIILDNSIANNHI